MVRWSEITGRRGVKKDVGRQQARHPVPKHVFKNLDVVRLLQDFDCQGGRIPKGTQGTILQVFDGGRAYQVEFEGPFDVPETVPAAILLPDVQPAHR